MVETINFREFYQKSPIPISENDRLSILNKATDTEIFENWTHWLIALEGNEMDWETIRWRVVVFPSKACGQFNFTAPFYKSSFVQSFNEALELSKELELYAKQDKLVSIHTDRVKGMIS